MWHGHRFEGSRCPRGLNLRGNDKRSSSEALEFPDDPNGQQAGISTGGIESFILAAHGK
jgi:hypothetical protein